MAENKTVLITGASGGIGYELAKQFAKNNFNLVLVARSKDKMEELKTGLEGKYKIGIKVISKDLARVGAANELFEELQSGNVIIDILVTSAGIGD